MRDGRVVNIFRWCLDLSGNNMYQGGGISTVLCETQEQSPASGDPVRMMSHHVSLHDTNIHGKIVPMNAGVKSLY